MTSLPLLDHALPPDPAGGSPLGAADCCRRPRAVGTSRYRLDGLLDRGGMGLVYRGWDLVLERELAIKVQRPDDCCRPGSTERFFREAAIAGRLVHPGIVPVYDAGRLADGRPFLAMPRVRGRTLAAALAARPDPADDLARWVKVVAAVARTLGYAHALGVVHRDVKPANVLTAGDRTYVIDWGLAKTTDDPFGGLIDVWRPADGEWAGLPDTSPPTTAGSALGTPGYAAPEQARGEHRRVAARADVFGLGAVLCEVLTGGGPFDHPERQVTWRWNRVGYMEPALDRLHECPADRRLVRVAERCLAADPADRPADGSVVAELLDAALAPSAGRRWRTFAGHAAAAAAGMAAALAG